MSPVQEKLHILLFRDPGEASICCCSQATDVLFGGVVFLDVEECEDI